MKNFIKYTTLGSMTISCICCTVSAQTHDPTHHLTINNDGLLQDNSTTVHVSKSQPSSENSARTTGAHSTAETIDDYRSNRGSWILRGGISYVTPCPAKENLTINKTIKRKIKTSASYTGALSLAFISDADIGIELAVTYPKKLKADISQGGVYKKMGSIQYHQTALTAQYYFLPEAKWSPYAGIGAAYNWFKPALESSIKKEGQFKGLSNSVISPVVQAGIDYNFNQNWLVNASLSYSRMTAKTVFKYDDGTKSKLKYNFNPFIARVNIGYRF